MLPSLLDKSSLKWTGAKWKTVLSSDKSKFEILFGNHGHHVLHTKEERDHPACYVGMGGCISAPGMGSLHIWKGTINIDTHFRTTYDLVDVFVREGLTYFSKTMLNCILHPLWQHSVIAEESNWLNWPVCSPLLQPIWKHLVHHAAKVWQRRPRSVEQLETYIRWKWNNTPLQRLQQLVSTVLRRLRTVV